MHHRLFLHIVWTTRDRAPAIDARTAHFLEGYLHSVLRQERAELLAIGIVQTHVHLLVRVHPMTALPHLLQRLKGGSGQLATRQRLGGGQGLKWAKGYSVQTVSWRALQAVREYVLNQERRHPHEAIDGWVPSPTMFHPPGVDGPAQLVRHPDRAQSRRELVAEATARRLPLKGLDHLVSL